MISSKHTCLTLTIAHTSKIQKQGTHHIRELIKELIQKNLCLLLFDYYICNIKMLVYSVTKEDIIIKCISYQLLMTKINKIFQL